MKKYLILAILIVGLAGGKTLTAAPGTYAPGVHTPAQVSPAEKEIIAAMDDATVQWNKGNLDGYMALYDGTATMMTGGGRVGIDSIRRIYVVHYFVNGQPKQQLSYDTYQLTMLGKDHALLTGRFMLKANDKFPERHGVFSLTMIHRKEGWRILHDHSS